MLTSIYITQYIGIAFILSAAMVIFRKQGVPLDKLALLNLAVLPMIGKVLYAPLIDKYRLRMQGKYRSWLIISNSMMVLLLIIVGTMNISEQFITILCMIGLYVFFMSIQDVSVDGLSCKLFPTNERKFASSVQFSGNLLGNIIGGGLLLIFYPWLNWQGSFWILAGLTTIALVQVCIYKEPLKGINDNNEDTKNLLKDIKLFCLKHKYWFVALIIYPYISTWGFSLLNPILVDSGWALESIGFSVKIFGSIVGLISAILAAPFITKVGRHNALISALAFQAFALVLMILPALGYTDKLTIYLTILTHFISFPALLVITSTIFMDNASITTRKATFFTLQFSVASLFGFIYSWASLAIAKSAGYAMTSIVGSAISILVIFAVWRLTSKTSINTAPMYEKKYVN